MTRSSTAFRVALVVAAAFLIPSVADAGEPLEYGTKFTMPSKVLGEERTIWVHTPPGYATSETRYPVLYLTDGPGHFLHTAGTVEFLSSRGRMPAMIIVGIANTDRTRDLTPTRAAEEMGRAFPTSGGADAFLKFIHGELIPRVEKEYRTQPYRVLAGHSFGGLFVMHAFLTRTDLFDAYLAVSPSLWWDNEVCVRRAEEFFKDKKKLERSLYLTLGDEGERMQKGYDSLKGLLAKHRLLSGFRWDSKQFPDEDHGSVVLRSHYFGLKGIFDGWFMDDAPGEAGIATFEAIKKHYAMLSKRFRFEVKPGEPMVNAFGYETMAAGQIEDAIQIFTYNAQIYPASANVYDSLGEALEKSNRLESAQANYKKAWELGKTNNDPNTAVFKTNYERVTEERKKKAKAEPEKANGG